MTENFFQGMLYQKDQIEVNIILQRGKKDLIFGTIQYIPLFIKNTLEREIIDFSKSIHSSQGYIISIIMHVQFFVP